MGNHPERSLLKNGIGRVKYGNTMSSQLPPSIWSSDERAASNGGVGGY
jgi:hypothetical protein